MQLRNRVVVVTGGASGIGEALCRRFAEEGARGVVVADLDAAGAERVARATDALAVATDVRREGAVRALVERARQAFGASDRFCANAGVALGAGLGNEVQEVLAPDSAWQASWEVNLLAHLHAARAVLPEMLERGEGYLLQTASAAGLLTDLGTLPYSVTKHAAVAFAEWLAIRYGDRGIRVSCLCPQGVRTPMLTGAGEVGAARHLAPEMIEPEEVASAVIEGLEAERFLILPHPRVAEYYERRAHDTDRWLAGMRRLRSRLYGDAS